MSEQPGLSVVEQLADQMMQRVPTEEDPAVSRMPEVGDAEASDIPDPQLKALLDLGMSSTAAQLLHEAGEAEQVIAAATPPVEEVKEPEIDVPFTDDEIDPKVRAYLLEKEKQIRALDAELKTVAQERAAQRTAETVESLFAGLEADYGDQIGKGRSDAFASNSKEAKNRAALFDRMNVLAAGYEKLNKPIDLKRIATEAAILTFPDVKKARAASRPAAGAVARVGPPSPPRGQGREAAIAALTEAFARASA